MLNPNRSQQQRQPATRYFSISGSIVAAFVVATIGLSLAFLAQAPSLAEQFLSPFDNFLPIRSSSSKYVDVLDRKNQITYRGIVKGSVEHFRNIFYAQDPSGEHRFAPPTPYLALPGSIIDATESGTWCSQGLGPTFPFASVVTNISENCLSLWISRPRGTKQTARLPVAVYLHGGGHGLGSAYEIMYTPDGLVRQSTQQGEPVLHVGINYRLGIFGFANTDALLAKGHTNAGLRDQLAAFEWVRANIAPFGGDPTRVTAVGSSVGSADIGLHLTAFGGDKGVPFQQAVMIGAAPNSLFNLGRDDAKERTALIAEECGCSGAAYSDSMAMTQCLRDVPWEKLTNISVEMMRKARPPFGEQFFAPSFDGELISELPSVAMRKGRFNKGIPLIAAWNRNDGAWLPSKTITMDDEVINSIAISITGLSDDSRTKILASYPVSDFVHMVPPGSGISPQYFRAAQICRDFWFTCPTIDFTWQYARHGGIDNVWLYENNQTRFTPVFERMGVPFWGVSHLSDLSYVFNIQDLPGGIDSSSAQLASAQNLSSQIIAFINRKPKTDRDPTFSSEWTPAYVGLDPISLESEVPSRINVKIFSGPEGSAMASVTSKLKDFLPDKVEAGSTRDDWVAQERLFERCGLINSAKLRREMAV